MPVHKLATAGPLEVRGKPIGHVIAQRNPNARSTSVCTSSTGGAALKHPARVRKIARERFGFDNLRSGQEEAIVSVLEGHDTLAVMPPGAGKSVIYQIPALMMPGPTVVISPIPFEAATPAPDALRRDLEFLFFAPEQLQQQETLDGLQAARPSLLVFDEAHCIDDWGPEVLRLRSVLKTTGCPTVIALTAKADLAMHV